MLSLLGSIIGGFTTWAERLPRLELWRLFPHTLMPVWEMSFEASLLGLLGVAMMWTRRHRLGGVLVAMAAVYGLFGASQLWITAGCTLLSGGLLSLFSTTTVTSKRST